MVQDGVEGETYPSLSDHLYSPDSQHLAYKVVKGNLWHVVIDGQFSKGFRDILPMSFNPDGSLVFQAVRPEGIFIGKFVPRK